MKHVLVTVSRGIIENVWFFDDPGKAIRSLSDFVKAMDVEHYDAALYNEDGLVANAKNFLDERDGYIENRSLVETISRESDRSIYIIGNPHHHLGFMVASPDDPLGCNDPLEALSELGQMRKEFGSHLKMYRIAPINGPMATRSQLEKLNMDSEIENFDYSLVDEYFE